MKEILLVLECCWLNTSVGNSFCNFLGDITNVFFQIICEILWGLTFEHRTILSIFIVHFSQCHVKYKWRVYETKKRHWIVRICFLSHGWFRISEIAIRCNWDWDNILDYVLVSALSSQVGCWLNYIKYAISRLICSFNEMISSSHIIFTNTSSSLMVSCQQEVPTNYRTWNKRGLSPQQADR
jgi:hypothetical protein